MWKIGGLALGFIREQRIAKKQLLGIGIGLAGIVDAENGVLRQSPIYGWDNVPLRAMLQSKLHIPVYIENDVNTLTLTEKWFGQGQGVDHFLIVTVGRGVGPGIVTNGQFYRGQSGGAGELGMLPFTPMDPYVPAESAAASKHTWATRADPHGTGCGCSRKLSTPVNDVDELISLARSGERAAI